MGFFFFFKTNSITASICAKILFSKSLLSCHLIIYTYCFTLTHLYCHYSPTECYKRKPWHSFSLHVLFKETIKIINGVENILYFMIKINAINTICLFWSIILWFKNGLSTIQKCFEMPPPSPLWVTGNLILHKLELDINTIHNNKRQMLWWSWHMP